MIQASNERMPMLEINYIRGIYILMLLLEVGYSYWPFVGYTTRPHGLLMAGTVKRGAQLESNTF